jgi:iron complex outermembrane receptor protein
MKHISIKALLTVLAIVAFTAPTTALAQEEQDSDVMIMEEIVVTAQKREQLLRDVPLSISALTNSDIEKRGLVEMSSYLNSVPGVTMIDRGTSRNSIIFRGLSIDPSFENAGQSTVGVYFGETSLTGLGNDRGGKTDVRLVDMNRVEVLRGPQGTLYGASSLSGTVRNIPNAPNLEEFETMLYGEYSDTDNTYKGNYNVQAVINVPLADNKLAFRLVGYQMKDAGYIENIANEVPYTVALANAWGAPESARYIRNIGETEVTGGRLSVLWEPTDNLSITFIALTEKLEQSGLPEVQTDLDEKYTQARLDISDFFGRIEYNEDELDLLNLLVTYDFGWGQLLSSTSGVEMNNVAEWNAQGFLGGFLGTLLAPWEQDQKGETFAQEFRLTSAFDGPFQFIAGLFYSKGESQFDQTIYFGGDPANNPLSNPLDPILFRQGFVPGSNKATQEALFGEITYDFNEKWQATLGGRFFKYDARSATSTLNAFAWQPPVITSFDDDNSGETFKANLSYKPNPDTLLYAQWAEGYRNQFSTPANAGNCDENGDGFLDGTNVRVEDANQLDPDETDNYELGAKLTRLDGRLVVSAAVFHVDWTGLPLTFRADCGFLFRLSAGAARSRGVEFEGQWAATDKLRINFGAAYIDAVLEDDAEELGGEAGDPLPGSADTNFHLGFDYYFDIGSRAAFFNGDVMYVGPYYNNVMEEGLESGDYWTGRLAAGLNFDKFDLELFVRNIGNSSALTWVETPDNSSDTRAHRLRPRTIGLSARWRY